MRNFTFSSLPYRRYVTLMGKNTMNTGKQKPKDQAGGSFKRWNLNHVPKSLLKCTLQHLFAQRALRIKINWKKKLTWKSEDSFIPHLTKLRQGKKSVSVIIGEAKQTKVDTLEYDKRIELIIKDIVEAKAKCQKTLVEMIQQYDEFFTGISSLMAVFDSDLNPFNIDQDVPHAVPNMLTEAGLTSEASKLEDVAFGNLVDEEYQKGEEFHESKNVARIARVKHLENKRRIHDNIEKMLGMESKQFLDQTHLNESLQFHVSAISDALQTLMIMRDSESERHKAGTTSGGGVASTTKRGVKIKKKTRKRPKRPAGKANNETNNKNKTEKKKRKRQGKSGKTLNGKRRGRKHGDN